MINQQTFEQLNSILFKNKPEHSLRSIQPTMKNLEIKFIALKKVDTQVIKKNKIITKFWIADDTGSAFLNIYDDLPEGQQTTNSIIANCILPGDVFVMVGAYATLFKGMMNIHQGKFGIFKKISELDFPFITVPNHSLKNWENQEHQ